MANLGRAFGTTFLLGSDILRHSFRTESESKGFTVSILIAQSRIPANLPPHSPALFPRVEVHRLFELSLS